MSSDEELLAQDGDVGIGDAQLLPAIADDAAVALLHFGNDALQVLALDAHKAQKHLLELEREGRDVDGKAVEDELTAAEAAGSEIVGVNVLLLHAEERFEQHGADARAVFAARAVPQKALPFHREAQKTAQALLRLLVKGDAAIGVDHVIIRRAELLLDAAALRFDEEAGGTLCRDAARGRAEKGQSDIFGALEKRIGVFAALGIRAQIDDRADAEPFERTLRALGKAGEASAAEEFARFDRASSLRGHPAEVARVVESFEFQPLDLHVMCIIRQRASACQAGGSRREQGFFVGEGVRPLPPEKNAKQAAETTCFDRLNKFLAAKISRRERFATK